MNRTDAVPPRYIHTCTYEERRFGTCTCYRDSVQRNGTSQTRRDATGLSVSAASEGQPRAAEWLWRLQLLSSGRRIRLLRTVLGWSQEKAAAELGISRRTLIRHEQGQHRLPWMRNSLEMRLRQLEADYAEQLAAYVARGGRLPTWSSRS